MPLLASLRPRRISFEWNGGTPRLRRRKDIRSKQPLHCSPGTPGPGSNDESGEQENREDSALYSSEDEACAEIADIVTRGEEPVTHGVHSGTLGSTGLLKPVSVPRTPSLGETSRAPSEPIAEPVHKAPSLPSDTGSVNVSPERRSPGLSPDPAAPSPLVEQRVPSLHSDASGPRLHPGLCAGLVPPNPHVGPIALPEAEMPDACPELQEPGIVPDATVTSSQAVPPAPSLPSDAPVAILQPTLRMYLGSDALGLVIAPGDVLMFKGSGDLTRIGAAGGYLGHVMVVVAPPRSVVRSSPDAAQVEDWPGDEVPEIWRIPTVESTSREKGLYETETLLFMDRRTRQLKIFGEIDSAGSFCLFDVEALEVWQSPAPLRSDLRLDVMSEVLSEMRLVQANWSVITAARAFFRSAAWTAEENGNPLQTMSEIMASWEREPICTSVVISFWQRYLHRVATRKSIGATHFSAGERVSYLSEPVQKWIDAVVVHTHVDSKGAVCAYDLDIQQGVLPENIRREVLTGQEASDAFAVELIMNYMPVKADRGLPGDLIKAMGDSGWIAVAQVPLIFSQEVVQVPTYVAAFAPKPEH